MCHLESAVERPWLTPITKMRDILPHKCGIDLFGAICAAKHYLYWIDEGWYVGRLREVPGVFSQGVSLQELEENIRDAYQWGVGYECCNSRSDEQR
jgi:hypothetical protein